jgi:predicted TIM-barrel fold metal-dependent hydrolase
MKGKIALEEAVTLPQLAYQAAFHAPQGREDELVADLLDIHSQRLRRMDEYGVEYTILSITSPGAQGFGDKAESEAFATEANDYLAKEMAKNPKRFGGFCVTSAQTRSLTAGIIHARCGTSFEGVTSRRQRIGISRGHLERLSNGFAVGQGRYV